MRIVSRLPARVIMVLAAAVVLALPGSAAAQRKFSFGYDQPRATAYGIAADVFDAKLQELSGGKLGINQFPGAQLGQEPVMLQKLRAGDIDFVITSTANAASVAPQAGVFFVAIAFAMLFPKVVLLLPKMFLPESVGCFRNPSGTGYLCP